MGHPKITDKNDKIESPESVDQILNKLRVKHYSISVNTQNTFNTYVVLFLSAARLPRQTFTPARIASPATK